MWHRIDQDARYLLRATAIIAQTWQAHSRWPVAAFTVVDFRSAVIQDNIFATPVSPGKKPYQWPAADARIFLAWDGPV